MRVNGDGSIVTVGERHAWRAGYHEDADRNRLEKRLVNPLVPSGGSNRPVGVTWCNHLPTIVCEVILIQCPVVHAAARSRRAKYWYAATLKKLVHTAIKFQSITGRDPISNP